MTDEERAYNYASKQKASKFQIGEIAKFYNDGYKQAEKDNKLTWEDIKSIDIICLDVDECGIDDEKEYYQEILKRFKERKEK